MVGGGCGLDISCSLLWSNLLALKVGPKCLLNTYLEFFSTIFSSYLGMIMIAYLGLVSEVFIHSQGISPTGGKHMEEEDEKRWTVWNCKS